uniref:Uncharacterized protein n=1 Tax=Anguilla anguilla TaxID=7936 RepID=A0A0E9UUM9_ANGAN
MEGVEIAIFSSPPVMCGTQLNNVCQDVRW